jgi:hypothetical protein
VDLERVELPAALRARVAAWQDAPNPIVVCCLELRHRELPDDVLGWMCGTSMLDDDRRLISRALIRHAITAAPHAVDAFATAVRGGAKAVQAAWKSIEELAQYCQPVPESLIALLPVALCLDQGVARGVALRLVQELGAPARAALVAARATATPRDTRRLDEALALLDGGDSDDDTSSLARLLEAWRVSRDASIEPAIVQLGAEAARRRGAIAARSRHELEVAWQVIAARRDPADLDRLLLAPWPDGGAAQVSRIEALRNFAPDPRIERALPRLRELSRAPTAMVELALSLVEAASQAPDRLAPASPAILAEAARITRPPDDLAALWAQHAEAPDDLALRAVLGDALQAAGDPRGELIALQLAGGDDPRARRRAAALIDAHADAWTAGLPGVDRASRRFARGFLVAVRTGADSAALRASLDRPEWRTVETLEVTAAGVDLSPLLPRLPLLRTLVVHHDDCLALLDGTGPFPRIRALATGGWLPPDRRLFPDLAVAAPGAGRLPSLLRGAVRLGLDALVLTRQGVHTLAALVRAARDAGPPELRLAFGSDHGFDGDGWRVRLRRDQARAEVAWVGSRSSRWRHASSIAFDLVRAGITEATYCVPDRLRSAHEADIARAGLTTLDFDGAPIDLAAP